MKAVPLAESEAGPFFEGTYEEVTTGKYPLSRFLYVYVNKTPNKPLKANTDLERVGDQAVNIAQTALGLLAVPPLKPTLEVGRLGDVALAMLHDSMTAFVENDVSLARSVLLRDDEADGLRDTIFRVLLTHMMADPGTVERALGLILVSRALERIADHATNIAEDLIFLVEGRIVRLENIETADHGRREPDGKRSS